MVQAQTRTALSGPALVRLLARIANLDVHEPAASLSDRLSQWLGWTDAIALSTALADAPPAPLVPMHSGAHALEEACMRMRASLVNAVAGGEKPAAGRHRARVPTPPPDDLSLDFAAFRQRYVSLQQTMETNIGPLRGRLRAALAAQSPDLARLAAVDAVMEQALSARERSLLAHVPVLLGKYFERMKRAAADQAAPVSNAWLEAFRDDMRHVSLAELEVRFQPVEGLLSALRTR
ncbi:MULTISPECIES: DUF3348 domain-containing protein [unclassified Caballeronia]|uniref:DUF3348 domain-containing protein n=1 Tax=unclassified Caballeronia TaxID=2646786 RepID=UPI0028559A30|nr:MULTISPECIES: DUF3348 domain-containing protein [unclassified Caballeronia]MDR5774617.1 DUF3348 domain-containing protein [Caballeronia sp. LZ002]MDR5850053.1 DUF3348 domain-containing protein [Caballeronia sp. LZ003]